MWIWVKWTLHLWCPLLNQTFSSQTWWTFRASKTLQTSILSLSSQNHRSRTNTLITTCHRILNTSSMRSSTMTSMTRWIKFTPNWISSRRRGTTSYANCRECAKRYLSTKIKTSCPLKRQRVQAARDHRSWSLRSNSSDLLLLASLLKAVTWTWLSPTFSCQIERRWLRT